MQVKEYKSYGSVILPEVVDTTNNLEFIQKLNSLCDKGWKNIKVDCNYLEMIDSAGLGTIVLVQKKLKESGGELELINVTHSYIKHLFNMIELNQVIRIEEINE